MLAPLIGEGSVQSRGRPSGLVDGDGLDGLVPLAALVRDGWPRAEKPFGFVADLV